MLLEALSKNPHLIVWSRSYEVKIEKENGKIGVQIGCVQVWRLQPYSSLC